MPYQVVCSDWVTAQLTDFIAKASEVGMGEMVRSTALAIVQRLQADPYGFGEPSHHLYAAQLGVRIGAISPLVVHYAVKEEPQVVFIVRFHLLPGHGL